MKKEEIKHLFDSYPEQNEFHIVADGTAFLDKNAAIDYAVSKKISIDAIDIVKRNQCDNADAKTSKNGGELIGDNTAAYTADDTKVAKKDKNEKTKKQNKI